MADQYFAASEALSLTATTATIALNIALLGTTRRFAVNEVGVSFNGVTSSAVPVQVRLVRTTSPTATNATQVPTPSDPASPASLCGGYTATATVGVILRTWYVSPTSGLVLQFPLGQELDSNTTSGAGIAVQLTAPATVLANTYMLWSE